MNDLSLGSFSDDGPWEVDPDRLSWLPGLDHVRRAVRAEAPALVKPKKLPPGGRMAATARHLGVGLAIWAAGKRRKGGPESIADLSRRLRKAAERLGPAYIKLGQIISSGEGVFPEPLVAEFKKCRDQVPPETWDTVRRVVEEDLGRPVEAVFSRFDREPLAAASIAQVHAATLRSGEEVVVKVQRPQVNRLVKEDLAVMAWVAPRLVGRIPVAALANPPALVELFAETIVEELDFRLEAENMLDVARSLVELGQKAYVVPRPHPDLVTRRVLVMERLSGFAYDDVSRHAGRRRRHVGPGPGGDDRLPRGRHAVRDLPRRPPRREPLRPPRRPDGPPRLRHHRPARRVPPPGLPPAPRRRHRQRRPGADGRPCGTSARCRPTPTSTPSSPTSASTARRSTPPR